MNTAALGHHTGSDGIGAGGVAVIPNARSDLFCFFPFCVCLVQLELWEQSLQALEAITLRCPNKVTPYVPNIVRLATQLSTFDPLYSYDADADMAKGKPNAKAAEEGWGDDAGDEGWGDEGDAEMNGPHTPRNTRHSLSLFAHPFAGARSACHHPIHTSTTLFLHVSQLLPALSLPWRCLH